MFDLLAVKWRFSAGVKSWIPICSKQLEHSVI